MFPTPEDLPFLLDAWHGRLNAHGFEISIVDSTVSFGAFHPLVLALFVWTLSVSLPLLRLPLGGKTVFASLDGCGLSFLSAHVFLFVPSALWFIFLVSEDLHFLKFLSTSAPWSPMDIATVILDLSLRRLGLWLRGCGAPTFQSVQCYPTSILFRVCLPECWFSMPGPWDGHCLGVRDCLRCVNRGSRSSVLVCDFHAPGRFSALRISEDWLHGWLSTLGVVDSLLDPAALMEFFQPCEPPVQNSGMDCSSPASQGFTQLRGQLLSC